MVADLVISLSARFDVILTTCLAAETMKKETRAPVIFFS